MVEDARVTRLALGSRERVSVIVGKMPAAVGASRDECLSAESGRCGAGVPSRSIGVAASSAAHEDSPPNEKEEESDHSNDSDCSNRCYLRSRCCIFYTGTGVK